MVFLMTSNFLSVTCKCGNELTVFSNSTMKLSCPSCNEVVAEPTGGDAVIHGKINKKVSK